MIKNEELPREETGFSLQMMKNEEFPRDVTSSLTFRSPNSKVSLTWGLKTYVFANFTLFFVFILCIGRFFLALAIIYVHNRAT